MNFYDLTFQSEFCFKWLKERLTNIRHVLCACRRSLVIVADQTAPSEHVTALSDEFLVSDIFLFGFFPSSVIRVFWGDATFLWTFSFWVPFFNFLFRPNSSELQFLLPPGCCFDETLKIPEGENSNTSEKKRRIQREKLLPSLPRRWKFNQWSPLPVGAWSCQGRRVIGFSLTSPRGREQNITGKPEKWQRKTKSLRHEVGPCHWGSVSYISETNIRRSLWQVSE